jgi:hypothetical protein
VSRFHDFSCFTVEGEMRLTTARGRVSALAHQRLAQFTGAPNLKKMTLSPPGIRIAILKGKFAARPPP